MINDTNTKSDTLSLKELMTNAKTDLVQIPFKVKPSLKKQLDKVSAKTKVTRQQLIVMILEKNLESLCKELEG